MAEIADANVLVKLSTCQKCGGVVRVAVAHLMNKRSTKEFALEVVEHDLTVTTIPLLTYRETSPEWCKCPPK